MDYLLSPVLFWPLVISAGVSFSTTALIVKWGSRLKIVDDPRRHRHPKVVHSRPVPRGGGIPIFIALLTMGAWTGVSQRVVGIILGAAVLAGVGFLDDRYEEKISPYLRLGLNILAAGLVIGSGIGIAYITNPLGGTIDLSWPRWCLGDHCLWVWSDLFALLWLVAMQNVVGWSSGVDGQMPGFVVIAALTMAALGLRFGADAGQWPLIVLALVTAGAYLGFLPWNFYPQKIMPGYGGKSLAGFLLGVLAIMASAKVGAMIMVLGLPIIDAVLVVVKRLREHRSPVWGGYEHFHHLLLDRGWGKRRIAVFYWGVSLILAVAALRLNSGSKYFTMAAVSLIAGGVILWLQNWSTFSKPPAPGSGSKI